MKFVMLKPYDLMINDWVYRNGKPTQVTTLANLGKGAVGTLQYMMSAEDFKGDITPIPVNADFFKANGFTEIDSHHYELVINENIKIDCVENIDGWSVNMNSNVGFHIVKPSVHELQHAWRLLETGRENPLLQWWDDSPQKLGF